MLRSALKFAAGAAAGVSLWMYLTPLYHSILVGAAEPILHFDRRLRHVEMVVADRRILARGGAGQPALPAVLIPADQLTYNVILLLGLLTTNRAPFRDRGAVRIALALSILAATHVIATAVAAEATYATKTAWGRERYAALEQDFWAALEYAYRLAGMFGIAFACWWMTRLSDSSEARTAPARPVA